MKSGGYYTGKTFFFLCLGLTFFGILFVYNASSASATADFGDKYYFVKDQLQWFILGLVGCFLVSRLDYRRFFNLTPYFLLLTLGLLCLVFIPSLGVEINGAKRWVDFRFFVFQPAELVKLALVGYLAAWFSVKDKKRLYSFLVLWSLTVGLVVLQPDMGTAVVIGVVGLAMLFLSEVPIWKVLLLALAALPLILIVSVVSPYRVSRWLTFLHPEVDPQGVSYQINQILLALGSGGLFGRGLGNSRQKYSFLPEVTSDSIFAVIGEEIGFLGVALFLLAIIWLVKTGLALAERTTEDKFGQLLIGGVVVWIAVQTMVNLGSMVALLPLTGVPLPFISYGGSALVAQWLAVGLVLSVCRLRK